MIRIKNSKKIAYATVVTLIAINTCSNAEISPLSTTKEILLKNCECVNCDLSNADLSKFQPGNTNPKKNPFITSKNKDKVAWLNCDLSGANLSYADLNLCNFQITLRGYTTPIAQAKFVNTNLSHAHLRGCNLYGNDFRNANLSFTNMSHANISLGDYTNTNFSHSKLQETTSKMDAMHGWGSDWRDANFSYSNLERANLYGLFRGANFHNANLNDATLISGPNAGQPYFSPQISLTDAERWENTDFSNANLKGARIFNINGNHAADLSKAKFCHTVMPDGKINNRDC